VKVCGFGASDTADEEAMDGGLGMSMEVPDLGEMINGVPSPSSWGANLGGNRQRQQ
jgi:hypothetical protein